MKKKVVSVICGVMLSFAMVVGTMHVSEPLICRADSDEFGVAIGEVMANSRSFYQIYDTSKIFYDDKNHTLYLTDADINTGITGISYGLCEYDKTIPFTIVLKGKSSIDISPESEGSNPSIYGIRSDQFTYTGSVPLVIKGNGSLNIKVDSEYENYSTGIVAAGGLTIKGKAKVKVSVGGTEAGHAICLDNDVKAKVKLDGSAQLTAYSPKGAFYKFTPSFGKKYTPKVKAGKSSSNIKINKKKPAKKVYTKYNYVSIKKA